MSIMTTHHKASEIMTMLYRGPLPGSLPFADSNFRATESGPNFVGAGLYACFFGERLIYIGKYLGKRQDWQQGNVIEMRWIKHVGTFTMRARNLGFSAVAYDAITEHCAQQGTAVPEAIRDAFRQADCNVLQRETGCMTTYRRFLVASRIHAEKDGLASPTDFSFLYTRMEASSRIPQLRERVSAAEVEIFQKIHPQGNTIRNAFSPAQLNQSQIRTLFEETLGGRLTAAPTSIPTAKPRGIG